MENQTFIEFYRNLPAPERDQMARVLSEECNAAVGTIEAWGRGYRTPKERSQVKIAAYLKTAYNIEANCQTLFPQAS